MVTVAPRPTIAAGPSRQVFDVLVVGGQLGGPLAGALLAKRGYKVCFVEHDGMGAGYTHDGFVLPYAPFITPPLRTMPAVEEAFTELGLTTTVQRLVRPHQPELQLVLPRHRLDLPADAARRAAELRREFGAAGAQLLTQLEGTAALHEATDPYFRAVHPLPPEGMLETFSARGEVKKHPGLQAPHPLPDDGGAGTLLRQLLPFLSYAAEPRTPLAQARPLSQALRLPGRFPAGRDGLRDLLVRRLTELGGKVLGFDADRVVVEHLVFDGARFTGLKLLQSESEFIASALVSATDAGALRRLVTDRRAHRKLLEQLDLSSTRKFLFTLNWVVPTGALPRGMGELVLLDSSDPELGPVLVQVHGARKVEKGHIAANALLGAEDESLRVVCAGAFIPMSARDLGEEHLRGLADRLAAQLDELMPFAREALVLSSAPYLAAGGVRGSRLLPHPLYAFETEAFLGVTGLGQRTAVKNLFLAGREVLPGLGLEGELLAGVRAARLVQELLRKKDPLKR